jgi:hypothetical protein
VISAHSGPLADLAFSPFNDNLLATAGKDGLVKVPASPPSARTLVRSSDSMLLLSLIAVDCAGGRSDL